MSFFEIIIIAAAGFFLLWLWRGGGQPRHAVANVACAGPRCRPARSVGCFGVLGALLIAGLIMALQYPTRRLGIYAPMLAVGVIALAFIGRWGWIGGFFGLLMLAVLGASVSVVVALAIPHFDRHIDEHVVDLDDLFDGPAHDWSPFRQHHIERAHGQAMRDAARQAARQQRDAIRGRIESKHRELAARFHDDRSGRDDELTEFGAPATATLEIRLKGNAFAEGEITPDALAATVLTMVDMLTLPKPDAQGSAVARETTDSQGTIVSLPALNELDVNLRRGGVKPVHEFVRLVKRSRLGSSSSRIDRIEITTSGKSKRHERDQLKALGDILVGVEGDRRAQAGPSRFNIAIKDASVVIGLKQLTAEGIPVEQDLAVSALSTKPALPAQPATAIAPTAVPSSAAPAGHVAEAPAAVPAPTAKDAAPAPPAQPAVPEPPKRAPEQATWSDTVIAYHLMMSTLPESLGGAAQYQPVSDDNSPAVAPQTLAVEIAAAKQPTPEVPVEVKVEEPRPDIALSNDAAADASANSSATTDTSTESSTARPAWVDSKVSGLDDKGVFYIPCSTGRLYDTAEDSHEAVDEILHEMTAGYVKRLLGAEAASNVSIPIGMIRTNFVEATWDERGRSPGALEEELWETHVLMKFDWVDNELIEREWQRTLVAQNLRYTGAGTALVLAMLGTVFGYLKLDTATRGYYSGRLKLAAGAMMAAITTLGILLAAGTFRL